MRKRERERERERGGELAEIEEIEDVMLDVTESK